MTDHMTNHMMYVHTHSRSASVQVKEDNTYFLTVSRSDFKRILLSVESTNIRFEEHGKEVLLLEKARQGRYLVVKGRPDRMLDHLLESEIEIGSQEGMQLLPTIPFTDITCW